MALLRKILGITFVAALVFFVSLLIFLRFQGKALIEHKVSAIFHRHATVSAVHYRFPLGLQATDLNVEGLLFAADARVSGSLDLFAVNRWGLQEVVLDDVILTIHRTEQGVIEWQHAVPSTDSAPVTPVRHLSNSPAGVIKKLAVTNGKVMILSHQSDNPADVSLLNVRLTAINVPLTNQDLQVPFTISGRIFAGGAFNGPNQFKAEGWLNWLKRDLQASGQVTQLAGKMDVLIDARSQSNAMTVNGHVKVKPNSSQGAEAQDALSVIFQQAKTAVDLDFSFTTPMDRWELRNIDFSGNLSPFVTAQPAAE